MSGDSSLDLGPVEEFPTGRYRLFEVGRREIGVVRLADGSVHAVLNRCPHRGAPVCRGVVTSTLIPSDPDDLTIGYEGEIVRCPWHGYEFSVRSGECLFIRGPARQHGVARWQRSNWSGSRRRRMYSPARSSTATSIPS